MVEDQLTTYTPAALSSLLNANSIEPFLPQNISVCTRGHADSIVEEPLQKLLSFDFKMHVFPTLLYDVNFSLTKPSVMA